MQSRFLSPREIAQLREVCGSAWLPFEVALQTGLRIGDVLKIRPQDIRGDYVYFTAEKTKKSGRAKIGRRTARLLRENSCGSGWCFPGGRTDEKHLTRQAAWSRLKKAAERAGIGLDGVSPHALRKSFAVELFSRSDLATVQSALQHTNAHITELYALSDWSTGKNAGEPLLRSDVPFIVSLCVEAALRRLRK